MRSAVVISGLAAALLIAGCGTSTTAGSGQPSGGSSATGAVAGSGGGSSTPAGGAAVDVCTLLPPADLSKITGASFTDTKLDSVAGVSFTCDYTSAGLTQLDVSVTTAGGKIGYDADVQVLTTVGHPPTPVSGVGDKAFSEHSGIAGIDDSNSFGALYGDVYIDISGLNAVTADQGTQIVQELHGKL